MPAGRAGGEVVFRGCLPVHNKETIMPIDPDLIREKGKKMMRKHIETGYTPCAVKVSTDKNKERAHLRYCMFEVFRREKYRERYNALS